MQRALREAGLVPDNNQPVKILGEGELTRKLTVVAGWYSKSAHEKIAAAGGTPQNSRGETFEFPKPKKKFVPRAPVKKVKVGEEVPAEAAPKAARRKRSRRRRRSERRRKNLSRRRSSDQTAGWRTRLSSLGRRFCSMQGGVCELCSTSSESRNCGIRSCSHFSCC